MRLGAVLFLGCFAVYLPLVAPTIALEDSGEFATAAMTLSLTHPPGYPVYLLLGRLAAALPVGSPPFRLALGSAACAALAAALTAALAARLFPGRTVAAAAAGVAFAFAPALAQQAAIADKYPLHLALFAVLALIALGLREAGPAAAARSWMTAALVAGIAFSHHMQTLYLAPAFAALAWRERGHPGGARRTALVVVLAALGLSLKMLALPLLSAASPSLMFAPLDRAAVLLRYLSAYDYSGRFYAYTVLERLGRFWTQGLGGLVTQAGWPVLLLAAAGGWRLRDAHRGTLLIIAAGSGLALWLVSRFQIAGTGYYLLPAALALCLLAAGGITEIEDRAGSAAGAVMAVLIMVVSAWHGLPGADRGRYYGATDWGRNLLHGLHQGAVLVTQHDDDFYPPMYLQRVLHEREDVVVIHRPFLTRLWHHRQVERLHPLFMVLDGRLIPWGQIATPDEIFNIFLRSHLGKREVAFTYLGVAETAGGFTLDPDGSVFRIGRREKPAPIPRATAFSARLARFEQRGVFGPFPAGSRFAEVSGAWATQWTQLALRWYEVEDFPEARACLAQALRYPYTRVVREDLARMRATLGM